MVNGAWNAVTAWAVCKQGAVAMAGDYDPAEVLEYDDPQKFAIGPDQLLNFVKFRRSTRQYTEEPVSDADIAKILEMGRYTANRRKYADAALYRAHERHAARNYAAGAPSSHPTGCQKRG